MVGEPTMVCETTCPETETDINSKTRDGYTDSYFITEWRCIGTSILIYLTHAALFLQSASGPP